MGPGRSPGVPTRPGASGSTSGSSTDRSTSIFPVARRSATRPYSSVCSPRFAVLDEIDSGLDVDALRDVSRRVEAATKESGLGVLAITHYSRLFASSAPTSSMCCGVAGWSTPAGQSWPRARAHGLRRLHLSRTAPDRVPDPVSRAGVASVTPWLAETDDAEVRTVRSVVAMQTQLLADGRRRGRGRHARPGGRRSAATPGAPGGCGGPDVETEAAGRGRVRRASPGLGGR